MNRASRDYAVEFGGSMLGYVAVLLLSVRVLQAHPDAFWRPIVALAPLVPSAFALAAFIRFFTRMDELQRRIQLEAIAFAFGATGILTFAYGFLEGVGFPTLNLTLVFPVMIGLWGLAVAVTSGRYS